MIESAGTGGRLRERKREVGGGVWLRGRQAETDREAETDLENGESTFKQA